MKKSCFVICPLDDKDSKVRKRSDRLLSDIIRPVVNVFEYEVFRGDLVKDDMTIPDSISKHVCEDDLVVADLTDSNPNVFYELGKRHAFGGQCILLAQDSSQIPFDMQHHRIIKYDLENPEKANQTRQELTRAITALKGRPVQAPYPLTPERVVQLSGATVVIDRKDGHRDHYYLSEKMAQAACKRIFLMQRSSSLILGPEQGWEAERAFFHALRAQIRKGVEFFHVVSLEGIARHLARPQSYFLETEMAIDKLDHLSSNVGIEGPDRTWYFKNIPDEDSENDLKPDRQARTFIVELKDGTTEGVIVVDLGGMQSCFHIRGPKMRDFLQSCIEFYDKCHYLSWRELELVLSKTYSP